MLEEMTIHRWISPKYSAGKIFKRVVPKNQQAGNNNPQAVIYKHASEIMNECVKAPLYPVGIINQQVGMPDQSVGMTNRQVEIANQSVGMTN